jgi:hypothetical protein
MGRITSVEIGRDTEAALRGNGKKWNSKFRFVFLLCTHPRGL